MIPIYLLIILTCIITLYYFINRIYFKNIKSLVIVIPTNNLFRILYFIHIYAIIYLTSSFQYNYLYSLFAIILFLFIDAYSIILNNKHLFIWYRKIKWKDIDRFVDGKFFLKIIFEKKSLYIPKLFFEISKEKVENIKKFHKMVTSDSYKIL